LGGLDRGNIPFLSILNTFIYIPLVVLSFGSGCYMYPKKVCTSSSYEKKGLECPRLMQLVKKRMKRNIINSK
jgi:hypothetical protein